MSKDNRFSRRKMIKTSSTAVAGFGAISLSGSVAAQTDEQSSDFQAENYVEGENYIYRRVRDSETDMLLRFDLEKGEAKFAEIKSQSDPQALSTTSTSDDPLKKQTRSMTAASATVSIQSSNRNDGIEPSKIVDATQGVQTQSSGIIFQKVDVATDHLGDCGSVAYNNHKYYHVAMELGDYNFDDLGDAVAYGVVCDALFILVGSKSKALKKILKKMADTPLIRAIPDSICSFIFGTVLDGIFSGGDGTFALWDIDKNGWVNEPKLAVGGSSLYDPSPEYMRDNRKTNEYLGVHTGAFR